MCREGATAKATSMRLATAIIILAVALSVRRRHMIRPANENTKVSGRVEVKWSGVLTQAPGTADFQTNPCSHVSRATAIARDTRLRSATAITAEGVVRLAEFRHQHGL